MMKKEKILFICSGGTCRSPMAVWLCEAKLKENHINHCLVDCRGLFVEENARVNPKAMRAMELVGVPVRRKLVPTELTQEDLEQATLVLCMPPEHKAIIKTKFNKEAKTIQEAADFVDIADPYGGSQETYTLVAKQLDYAIMQILERLKGGKL